MSERPAPRKRSGYRRPPRLTHDAARSVALDVLREVATSDGYANLVLPGLLRERGLHGRDAAFATELAYGTLRLRGRYDAILGRCTRGRPLHDLDPPVLDILRLGAHQLLAMRVPAHAAVSETVNLARARVGSGAGSFVNAVLRAVGAQDAGAWLAEIGDAADPDGTDVVARLSVVESHPAWITRAMRGALLGTGRPATELEDVLRADNANPDVTLAVRPGLIGVDELERQATETHGPRGPRAGRWSPTAVVLPGGDPAALAAVRQGRAGVQDEGSQLVALALAAAPLGPREVHGSASEPDGDGLWLDLCAGPGGKAALLGGLAAERGARLVANEVAPHRARLVRQSVAGLPRETVEVRTGDGRILGEDEEGRYDRVLVDAPCTGLGALRRRPEARWRRRPADLADLGPLQRDLLLSALRAVRPGGVVGYVTCSPHLAETAMVVQDAIRRREDLELIDAVSVLQDLARTPLPGLGEGPTVQLWPHLHGTDAMFLALIRRR